MTFEQVKATLGMQLSNFYTVRTVTMRKGKYTAGMHFNDGYAAMLFETIMELEESETYSPMTKATTRELIRAFNKITASTVPDVWDDLY
jgi:hypothetical protein